MFFTDDHRHILSSKKQIFSTSKSTFDEKDKSFAGKLKKNFIGDVHSIYQEVNGIKNLICTSKFSANEGSPKAFEVFLLKAGENI